ncbi:hypothetical protein [Aeromonas enteropelogenes]|uniref:hypothetical protein n=1 Tax=Aeromonas enteropelogenes TaxID=29489 RepID=UPI003BA19D9A
MTESVEKNFPAYSHLPKQSAVQEVGERRLVMVEELTDEDERHLEIAKQVLKSADIKVEAISLQ